MATQGLSPFLLKAATCSSGVVCHFQAMAVAAKAYLLQNLLTSGCSPVPLIVWFAFCTEIVVCVQLVGHNLTSAVFGTEAPSVFLTSKFGAQTLASAAWGASPPRALESVASGFYDNSSSALVLTLFSLIFRLRLGASLRFETVSREEGSAHVTPSSDAYSPVFSPLFVSVFFLFLSFCHFLGHSSGIWRFPG